MGSVISKLVLVPPFPSIQPQMGFCSFGALAFSSAWEAPAVMAGRLAQPRAELCSVAQVGVGANSRPWEVSKAYTRKAIDHKEHREGIV